jgi:hypothetical protein
MSHVESPAAPPLPTIGALTRDFLRWLESAPRTYDETMTAWGTSCPRLTVWEDALADGFVRVERGTGGSRGRAAVVLTRRGHAALDADES